MAGIESRARPFDTGPRPRCDYMWVYCGMVYCVGIGFSHLRVKNFYLGLIAFTDNLLKV